MGNVGYEEKCLEYIIQKIAPAIALWPKLARISFQELALQFDEGGILVTKKSDPLSAVFEHFSYFYKFANVHLRKKHSFFKKLAG